MSEYIRAVLIGTDGVTVDTDIPNTLSALQEAVGGYIQTVDLGGIILICNEEGLLLDLPENYRAGRICGELGFAIRIVGNAVFVGYDGTDGFASLSDRQAELLERL